MFDIRLYYLISEDTIQCTIRTRGHTTGLLQFFDMISEHQYKDKAGTEGTAHIIGSRVQGNVCMNIFCDVPRYDQSYLIIKLKYNNSNKHFENLLRKYNPCTIK
jgi:hypothetical protein